MNLIHSYQTDTRGKWDFNDFGKSYSDRQLTRVSESHQENKDITIFTEDGDRVTITSNQQSQASYSKYSAITHQSNYTDLDNMVVDQNRYTLFQDRLTRSSDQIRLKHKGLYKRDSSPVCCRMSRPGPVKVSRN